MCVQRRNGIGREKQFDGHVRGRPSGFEKEFLHLALELFKRGEVAEGIRPQIAVATHHHGDPSGAFAVMEQQVLAASPKDPRGCHALSIGGMWTNRRGCSYTGVMAVQRRAASEL
jgi:hypothetical protein